MTEETILPAPLTFKPVSEETKAQARALVDALVAKNVTNFYTPPPGPRDQHYHDFVAKLDAGDPTPLPVGFSGIFAD